MSPLPPWRYFPSYAVPPSWVDPVIHVFADSWHEIDSTTRHDRDFKPGCVRRVIAPGLAALGFAVEESKKQAGVLPCPVLIGDQGESLITYELDALDAVRGIAVEVEVSHATVGSVIHRDLIQASLIPDVRFLAVAAPIECRCGTSATTEPTYEKGCALLETIYGSPPLILPFEGVLLIGY